MKLKEYILTVQPFARYAGKIRNLKAMGKKSSELSQEEQPCNFAEAKKIFARIVNYKATFEVLACIYCINYCITL